MIVRAVCPVVLAQYRQEHSNVVVCGLPCVLISKVKKVCVRQPVLQAMWNMSASKRTKWNTNSARPHRANWDVTYEGKEGHGVDQKPQHLENCQAIMCEETYYPCKKQKATGKGSAPVTSWYISTLEVWLEL